MKPGISKRKKPRAAQISTSTLKRVVVEFPVPLLTRAEKAVTELSTNRSELIRLAVQQYLELRERTKLENDLAEGYTANAQQASQACEEFAHADADVV